MTGIRRVPIKVGRKPIILPDHIKPQLKIWELMEETRDDDIYELSKHYDMLRMNITNKTGHNSLPVKEPTTGKNWIHFESIYEICRIQGWDAKLYIESQFEFCKRYNTKYNFPIVSMMYGKKALSFFIQYKGELTLKYEKDVGGRKKKRGKDTKALRDKVIEEIAKSGEVLADSLEKSKHPNKSEYKALFIFNHWEQLSPFYLYSVEWFGEIIANLDNKIAKKYKEEFDRISSSNMLKETIAEIVPAVEEHFKLPPTMTF